MDTTEDFFSTILYSWGSDTPAEVIWALNSLLVFAESKGFDAKGRTFVEEIKNEDDQKSTESLVNDLVDFFDNALYSQS